MEEIAGDKQQKQLNVVDKWMKLSAAMIGYMADSLACY